MRRRPPGEQRDVRVTSRFRDAVVRLELVPPPAQFCRNLRGELVTGGKEHLRAEALHQRPPAFVTRQRGPEGADALRGHDRHQLRLSRQRKRALVARRIRFADGRKGVVLVADEQQIPPDPRLAAP